METIGILHATTLYRVEIGAEAGHVHVRLFKRNFEGVHADLVLTKTEALALTAHIMRAAV